jgi:hypothetical protein
MTLCGLALGCSDDASTSDAPDETTPTDASSGALDTAGDAAGADVTVTPDVPEVAPEPKGPLALVYKRDPATDAGELLEVELAAPVTSADGTLSGDYVQVLNCLNEPGGESLLGFGQFCKESNVATPGPDGTYLHITPPANTNDPEDPFAEVMMFQHVNLIHHYFKNVHGLTSLDYPLQALVNVMIYIDPATAGFLGQQPGWIDFPNAAFIPEESFAGFGLPPRPGGAIVFGQYGYTDFSYDASVIYHEYTHAMVGTTRLTGELVDEWGLDNLPGAMNEGFADYFAASMSGHPYIGTYGLASAGAHLLRNLSEPRVCPEDLKTEVHADGKIIGSAMWTLRLELGQEMTDGIILRALQSFSQTTNVDQAANLIIDEAHLVSPEIGAVTEEALDAHGLRDCVRAQPWRDFNVLTDYDHVPFSVGGTQSVPTASFPDGAPAYVQLYVDVPQDAKVVSMTWLAQASQSPFGGGGGDAIPLKLAVRSGTPITFDWTTGGAAQADKVLSSKTVTGGWSGVLVDASCFTPGTRLYTTLLNPSNSPTSVTQTKLQILTAGSNSSDVQSCD